ncbi:two-component system sensor histidine kinase VicK [Pedobacter sp. W3I1]|uniref:PAS domain-containing sensor histidine kinase n=1 Tax=Pedobacter sp. W3I1 TaxID=3042291 RepID=UPI00277EDC38|nr:ATP-binding protein [Pedobacter sp. W3I1]MDQ0638355.1 two-component system sensor histidine kinase VicK [Pedobacter sp. W3I1]
MGLEHVKLSAEELNYVYQFGRVPTSVHIGDDATIVSANESMLHIWGKDKAVIGQPLEAALPELRGQPFLGLFKRAWLEGETITGTATPAELNVGGKIGTYFFDFEYRPVKNENGKIIAVINSAIDVTERVQKANLMDDLEETRSNLEKVQRLNQQLEETRSELAELNLELEERVEQRLNELSESESRFRSMADGTELLISVADEHGKTIYYNKKWSELTGREPARLMREGWNDLIHPGDLAGLTENENRYKKNFEKFSNEFRIRQENGDYQWMHCHNSPRFRADGGFAGYTVSCLDITERKLEEIRKNGFIDIISHELRTPLTSINAYIQVLKRKLSDSEDLTIPEMLEKAQHQINRMREMINSFLNLSRLESGRPVLNRTTFDLGELIVETAGDMKAFHSLHQFSLRINGDIPVNGDREKLRGVLWSLLNNAAKYSPYHSSIQVSCKAKNDRVFVQVEDEGSGIQTSHLKKIFGKFFRSEQNPTISGFGIGLYLCNEIVRMHNGEIWAENREPAGSRFTFTIPI